MTSLAEGASGKNMPPGALEMKNSFGDMGYGGPQPPRGTGSHQYVITVFALKDPTLDVKPGASLVRLTERYKGKGARGGFDHGSF